MKKLCLLMAVVMVLATLCSCGGAKNNAELEGNTYVEGFPIVKEKENWQKLTDDSDVTEEIYACVSEGYTVYHEFDSDGLISRKGLMSKEKFGGNSFA